MAFQQRDNSGALFRNDRKETEEHPDHTGQATVAGIDYWISAWVNEGGGKKYFRLLFKRKDQPRRAPPQNNRQPASRGTPIDMDDEIPF